LSHEPYALRQYFCWQLVTDDSEVFNYQKYGSMQIKSAEFVKSATKPAEYPPAQLPEIAFAGRSNVGKSSLINTLVNRKHLVKTSSTPGRTQLINFFDINQQVIFVDLPGYGYAKVPVSVRKKWGPMIETYLSGRKSLRAVVAIMDIRRTPKQEELNLLGWLSHYAIAAIVVLTKTDKLSKSKSNHQHRRIAQALAVHPDDLILFSAKSRRGRDTLWRSIMSTVENVT
jgi:GTP-binding protein